MKVDQAVAVTIRFYSWNCTCFNRYLFGQKVDGNAFVMFGVMDGEKKITIDASLQKAEVRKIKQFTSWDQSHLSSPTDNLKH